MTAHTHSAGDTVIVAARGEWFGHCGIITRITRSEHTDLLLHAVGGADGVWYADELAPAPHDNPALQVAAGPARDIIHAAQQAGWVTHVADTDRTALALISGPGVDGTYLRVRVLAVDGFDVDRQWYTVSETFDGEANRTAREYYVWRTSDVITAIDRHSRVS